MDRRPEFTDPGDQNSDNPESAPAPTWPPEKRRSISTRLPSREDPFNTPPSLAPLKQTPPEALNFGGSQQQPAEKPAWHNDAYRPPVNEQKPYPSVPIPTSNGYSHDDYPNNGYGQGANNLNSAPRDIGGGNFVGQTQNQNQSQSQSRFADHAAVTTTSPVRPVRASQANRQPAAKPLQWKRLALLPVAGLVVVAGVALYLSRDTDSDQETTSDNSYQATSDAADLATPSTLETKIVDLNDVADEDTLRLEIPLDAGGSDADTTIEVDSSLAPLTFRIADGQVRLSGTAQSEEQAAAMIEQSSLVFAGVDLVADYQVDPRAPSPDAGVVVQKPVVFESGSAEILPEYYPVLDACAGVLEAQPSLVMVVAGHTDNVGSDDINIPLAQQRAQAVIDYYVAKGLDDEQFDRVALASADPISTNETEEGRKDNRRTDLEFQGIFDGVVGATDQ